MSVGSPEPSETPRARRFSAFAEQLQQRVLAEPGDIPTDVLGRELADWTVRVVATSIDVLFLCLVQGVMKNLHFDSTALFIFDWLLAISYLCVIAWRGTTIGNVATRTKVVDANTGAVLNLKRTLLRTLALVGLLLTLIGAGIDVLIPLIDEKRQSIHDKAASSVVIRTGRIFPAAKWSAEGTSHGD